MSNFNENEFNYEDQGCLHEIFDRRVRSTPDAVVIVAPSSDKIENDRKTSYTLKELGQFVDLVSNYLRDVCDVVPDSCVGIYMEKCPEYVISYASILKAGGGYTPLDLSYPKPLLRSILDEAQPKAICTKRQFAAVFENGEPDLISGFLLE